jgi:DUF2934 family protein
MASARDRKAMGARSTKGRNGVRPPGGAARSAPSTHREASRADRLPAHEEIAVRAYEIYLSRGGSPGWDLDDWLEAERQLHRR